MRVLLVLLVVAVSLASASAQTPDWIWHDVAGEPPNIGVRFFRKSFTVVGKFTKAELVASGNDRAVFFINGQEVGKSGAWHDPFRGDVEKALKGGENVIAVRAENTDGLAGVVVHLAITQEYDKKQTVVTDTSWLAIAAGALGGTGDSPVGAGDPAAPSWTTTNFAPTGWLPAKKIATHGADPWGDALKLKGAAATPAAELTVAPGFKVELLKSATNREGSWASMAIDDKGRLYISPQNKAPDGGIMRLTLDATGHIAKTDWVKTEAGAAMGMLWAFDSLYVSGQGPDGQGIYRLRHSKGDADGDLDTTALFKKVPGGGGEHGAHAIVLGPDGKSLFFAHGNSTPLVEGIAADSPFKNYAEDDLLPRIKDPVATFFDKLKAPYGHILRTDERGEKWELYAGGMRNQYDIDFNADGELFTFDSDMEWDVGLPWYRPTRVLHIVPGAEFGFREGSAKWPASYPDSLPPVVEIGLGSPTGVKFGTRSSFPEKYRRAFFIMDWTFGRILAVQMQAKGASYTVEASGTAVPAVGGTPELGQAHLTGGTPVPRGVELFLSGKGLPVSDLEFGRDGAMYFITGGRGTQSGLYRVSWDGAVTASSARSEPNAADKERERIEREGAMLRGHRSDLERYVAGKKDALRGSTWPTYFHFYFDRSIRNAIRLAMEGTPHDRWRKAAPGLPHPGIGLTSLLALARVGTKADQEPLLKALAKWPLDSLDEELKLLKLRVIKVSFARQGRPSPELVALATQKLLAQYPAPTFPLNRELSELLIWLTKPTAGLASAPVPPESPALAIREAAQQERGAVQQERGAARSIRGPEGTGRGAEQTKRDPEQVKRDPAETKREAERTERGPEQAKRGPEPTERDAERTIRESRVTAGAGEDLQRAASEVVTRTLVLLKDAKTQEEQIWYATVLREARAGWTPERRHEYFAWFGRAKEFKGGNSLPKFIERIGELALANVPEPERATFAALLKTAPAPAKPPTPPAPAREFQKAWTVAELEPELANVAKGRNFARGKEIFASTQCLACHHFGPEGGNVGPDLSAVASRFQRRDILEATLEPSKAISEQYAAYVITTKKGDTLLAQIAAEDAHHLKLITDPLKGTKLDLPKTELAAKELSPVSLMPPGLLNVLTKDEVLDLLAYIESGGNEKAAMFAK